MLAGEPPFKGPNPQATLMRRFMGPPRPLRPMVQIPEHVEAAIVRALRRIPPSASPTAGEFTDALAGRAAPAADSRPRRRRPPVAAGGGRRGGAGAGVLARSPPPGRPARLHLLGAR